MKYMGSKRSMLQNGLGALLKREMNSATRFVDLFTGSASVAAHVATTFDIPVFASDLQNYSVALANAQIVRRKVISSRKLWNAWLQRAKKRLRRISRVPNCPEKLTIAIVETHRAWSENLKGWPLTKAYGGHYFSACQALWIDALRATLPKGVAARRAALASLIEAASFCAASPGHTAQPFQPTQTAKRFLAEAWSRDVVRKTKEQFERLCASKARRKGQAIKGDANVIAKTLKRQDLVFLDPPYSGVHYSRFYHVLEAIARGSSGEVSGVGRYPSPKCRPQSRYSVQSQSKEALDHLLDTIAKRGAKTILTFPNHKCSNGLSGYSVKKIAAKHFHVVLRSVGSRFSSLGGTSDSRRNQAGREARRDARELVLTLTPKG
jgi:adenine-specific DNA-methyltransferase